MFGITDYPAFVLAILVFLAIPGPGNLVLLMSTAKGGFRAGMAAMAGLLLADQLLMWSALIGLAAVLAAHPSWFAALKWVGAAYLAWLGIKLWRQREGAAPALEIQPRAYFRQGFVITAMNPKSIVFYMAFFPLFVDPARHEGVVTQVAMVGTVAVLTAIYSLIACALAWRFAASLRGRPWVRRGLEKLAATLLLGFGVRLALA